LRRHLSFGFYEQSKTYIAIYLKNYLVLVRADSAIFTTMKSHESGMPI
jgi:hypothetical protein